MADEYYGQNYEWIYDPVSYRWCKCVRDCRGRIICYQVIPGPPGPTGPTGATGPSGTITDYGVIFREFGNEQVVPYRYNVSFPENDITGQNIRHIENSTDIELSANKSYFAKYTVSYSIDSCASGDSKEIVFALTDNDGNVIPSSEHVASISRNVNSNSISLGVIITPEKDYVIRLTNLTQDVKNIRVNAATVTIFRLA